MVLPIGFADCSVFMKHELDPEEWAITFGVETDLAGFSMDAHAAHVFSATASNLAPQVDTEVTFTRARLSFGQDAEEPIIAEFNTSPIDGARAGNLTTQNTAFLVRKLSAQGGRTNRGRNFLPGMIPENGIDEVGLISAAVLASLDGVVQDWFAGLTDTLGGTEPSTPMVILHKGPLALTDPTPVTALVSQQLAATQRRRMRR